MAPKVLICDPIADEGVRALQEFGAEVDVRLRQSPEELIANIPEYDAVVVRSETKITAAAIQAAKRLPVVGRAGVGGGRVGSEGARRARGLEMRVIGYDPFVPEERGRVLGAEMVSLEDLLRQSDFISVHTNLPAGSPA